MSFIVSGAGESNGVRKARHRVGVVRGQEIDIYILGILCSTADLYPANSQGAHSEVG